MHQFFCHGPLRTITFKARSQALSATSGGKYQSVESEVIWEAGRTAVIVVDMWDDHWCPNAASGWSRWPSR